VDIVRADLEDGFEYSDSINSWALDDGFLFGLKQRLSKSGNGDLTQAGRLFFFHEALHYSKSGHNVTKEIASGIGQFPKVIEEADYQADVWALLNEYNFCVQFEAEKVNNRVKLFFCEAIHTAVETMWSFTGSDDELKMIQVRSMNRFLNWYWQWVRIASLDGAGTLDDVVKILIDKPIIEFAGLPMDLRGHRIYYKLNRKGSLSPELAAFAANRIHRLTPATIELIVTGFKEMDGEKIKTGLKSFQHTIGYNISN